MQAVRFAKSNVNMACSQMSVLFVSLLFLSLISFTRTEEENGAEVLESNDRELDIITAQSDYVLVFLCKKLEFITAPYVSYVAWFPKPVYMVNHVHREGRRHSV